MTPPQTSRLAAKATVPPKLRTTTLGRRAATERGGGGGTASGRIASLGLLGAARPREDAKRADRLSPSSPRSPRTPAMHPPTLQCNRESSAVCGESAVPSGVATENQRRVGPA